MALPVNDGILQIFDVEHGQCALLTVPRIGGGWDRVLVDCGHNTTTGWSPTSHFQRLQETKLQQLVVTNYDEDHMSNYRDFLDSGVYVEWLTRNKSVSGGDIQKLKSETGMGPGIEALVNTLGNFAAPKIGEAVLSMAGVETQTFYNNYPVFDDENNLSCIFVMTVHGWTFMFPGDMERAGFDHLLATNAKFRTMLPNVDVLIASHHGRENGICPDMFDKWGCKPEVVVISDDYMKYDTQKTTQYYNSKCGNGIPNFRNSGLRKVLTTRKDGDITFHFINGRCTVT